MAAVPMSQQRQHFRLRYPVAGQPSLVIGSVSFPVSELSEGGMRILLGRPGNIAPTGNLRGTLTLAGGATIEVQGTVLRIEDQAVVLQLTTGPTYSEMLSEQRYVARRFPDWPQTT